MENKKIGTTLLTGLITGSMLGSGIIILPPLAYKTLGNYAIFTWIIIVILGALFAKVFTNLSIQFPGDGGVSNAVESAFGSEFKKLTSYFLIFAVFTGPTAVMITAGEHLSNIYKFNHSINIYALIFIIMCSLYSAQKYFINKQSFSCSLCSCCVNPFDRLNYCLIRLHKGFCTSNLANC